MILKIKTLPPDRKAKKNHRPTWYDRDEILLHAAFQCLVDYMEKERPEKVIDFTQSAQDLHVWRELQGLYRWWTMIRPRRKDPILKKGLKTPPFLVDEDGFLRRFDKDKKYKPWYRACKESWKLGEKWDKEDQQNLHRLIEIRQHLWT